MINGKFIAGQANKTGDTTGQVGRKGFNFNVLPVVYSNSLEIHECRVKEYTQSIIGSVLIWGHPTYGIWDSYNWGNDFEAEYELQHIWNAHNYFPEDFSNNRFIDTGSSTGSWLESEMSFRIPYDGYFISSYIAMEDKVYKSVKISFKAESASGSDYTGSIIPYAIIDDTEYLLSNNISVSLANTSTEPMKIKLVNAVSTGGEDFPMTFPITFGILPDIEYLYIKEYQVKYST